MQLTGFEHKTALVTGASGGIGLALVRLLLQSGTRVIATDRVRPDFSAEFAQALETQQLSSYALDVTQSAEVDALVAHIEQTVAAIDMGVNVAGVLCNKEVTQTTDADWRAVFAVNCDGVFHVSRALARQMEPRMRGAIVTVSSNAAGIPRHAMAGYAASKAAATMFTRCLGLELAPKGIRCNIVAPGSTLTPMQTSMWQDETGANKVIAGFPEQYKTGIPLQKLATPEDVANAVMFLLSDQAGHIAMSDIYVDGGATLRA